MQVSEDTFELGKAIGQLLRGDARGANALLGWPPDQLAQQLERDQPELPHIPFWRQLHHVRHPA